MATAYLLTKTFHLLFVMAWMGAVFYLPRILVNIAEDGGTHPPVRERLLLMGRRLYRFGHSMFGLAAILGGVLWLYFGMTGGWLHAKLTVVALMLAYYIVSGHMLKAIAAGATPRSPTFFRWFNELPVFLLMAVIYLVIAKPF
jgi:protoporphyrinogen IX oxidase